MKTALHLKFLILFVVFFILIQGCTVYHSASVDFEKAVQSQKKVKIVTNSKDTYKFKKIIEKNNLYYGIAKATRNSKIVYSGKEKMENYSKNFNLYPLEDQNIKGIYTKNRALSTILSIGIPVVIVTTAIIIIVQSLDFSIGSDSYTGY